jgi:hypothetical protein
MCLCLYYRLSNNLLHFQTWSFFMTEKLSSFVCLVHGVTMNLHLCFYYRFCSNLFHFQMLSFFMNEKLT